MPSIHSHTPLHRIFSNSWTLPASPSTTASRVHLYIFRRKNMLYMEFFFFLTLPFFFNLSLIKFLNAFSHIISFDLPMIFEAGRPHILPLMLQSGKGKALEFKWLAQGNFANVYQDIVPRLWNCSQGSFYHTGLGTASRNSWRGFWKSEFWLYWKPSAWSWTWHYNLSGPQFPSQLSERLDHMFSEAPSVLCCTLPHPPAVWEQREMTFSVTDGKTFHPSLEVIGAGVWFRWVPFQCPNPVRN